MKRIFFTIVFSIFITALYANNIRVSDPKVDPNDYFANEVKIKMEVSWENSWKCDPGHAPHNWDAAWIFIKYRRSDRGEWQHATIKRTIRGSKSLDTIPSDKKGTMMFRKDPGFGTFKDTITIVWDRAADIEAAARPTVASEICAFAIEMVYVPQAPFFLGDGTLGDGTEGNNYGVFRKGGTSGTTVEPYYVQSESTVNVYASGNPANHIYYSSPTGSMGTASITLTAAFPKGYNAFYCMKTEISQGQYCAFLNKLGDQQIKPKPTNTIYTPNCLDFGNDEALLRKYGNTITKNGNNVYEVGDPYRACNLLTSYKVIAYLAWAGLRPMSFMEYEKACRGPVSPRRGEFAWGRTNPTNKPAQGFRGDPESETYFRPDSVVPNYLISQIPRGTEQAIASPGRVGAFATSSSDRKDAGASYYGILDLTGNVAELVVSWYWGSAQNFSRNAHGTGLPLVDFTGNTSNIASWPVINPTSQSYTSGYAHRGGHFMCKPTAANVNGYYWDNHTGMVCGGDSYGGNGASLLNYPVRTNVFDYSYNTQPGANATNTLFLHGYGGRGVRSF